MPTTWHLCHIVYLLAATHTVHSKGSQLTMNLSYLQIAILALIQGAAELLPVSSSAHVIVAERLMHLDPSAPELTFLLVMLHTGTMVAVLFYFWPRWRGLLSGRGGMAGEADVPPSHFIKMVILATAVTGVLGLGLKFLIERVVLMGLLGHEKGEVEHLFKHLPLIAAALFAVGIFILVAGSRKVKLERGVVSTPSAIWIGIVQGLCLPFRGFSRSGATISMALLRGISRSVAEDFSFALAVVLTPPVIVLEVYRLIKAQALSSMDLNRAIQQGLVGMVFSFLAGLVALKFLSWTLDRGRWTWFGIYCCLASAGVLLVSVLTPAVESAAR